MRIIIVLISCCFVVKESKAQQTGNFTLGGSTSMYYPVTFTDPGFNQNIATELELGRSNVHTNQNWLGSMISKFRYHTTNWGNGSPFIDATINSNKYYGSYNDDYLFVAGWVDVTNTNGDQKILIWLKGATTYYYKGNLNIGITIYDGVQNGSNYQETYYPPYNTSAPLHSPKSSIDSYVNTLGSTTSSNASIGLNPINLTSVWGNSTAKANNISEISNDIVGFKRLMIVGNQSAGADRRVGIWDKLTIGDVGFEQALNVAGSAYIIGNVGIGTKNLQNYKLAVEGTIGARKIKVTQETTWADYVFASDYKLLPLQDLETYIKQHQHLPDVPSATEVATNGIDIGDMQTILLKKIEELTLYMIELKKSQHVLENKNLEQEKKIKVLISKNQSK